MFSISKELSKYDSEQRKSVEKRIELVHLAQRRLGMEPRDDSLLTYKYACGELEEDGYVPSSVANELYIVDSLYQTTQYGTLIEDVLREIASIVKKKYKISWDDTWTIVRFYGPTMLKMYCSRGRYS